MPNVPVSNKKKETTHHLPICPHPYTEESFDKGLTTLQRKIELLDTSTEIFSENLSYIRRKVTSYFDSYFKIYLK